MSRSIMPFVMAFVCVLYLGECICEEHFIIIIVYCFLFTLCDCPVQARRPKSEAEGEKKIVLTRKHGLRAYTQYKSERNNSERCKNVKKNCDIKLCMRYPFALAIV